MAANGETIFCAYARQSLLRVGDGGDSASVADQFRSIEEYAGRLGGRIVARFSDVDVSGGIESRDGLDQLLEAVKTIRPEAVLIRDVSRLARDTRIFLTLVDTLQRSNVKLLSSTESLEDRTISVMLSAMAERERLALAGRCAGGVREHARRGKTHGRVAFGYRRLDGVLSIWEPEATMVRAVFGWFAAGDSIMTILNRLNHDPAMPAAPEADRWGHDTIARMLKRVVYAGDVEIKSRRDISGRQWPSVLVRDAHEAIVPREQFDAVQRRFCAPTPIVRQELVSPFSGFLICAACGGRIYATEQQRAHRPNNVRIARCGTRVRRHREGDAAANCPAVRGSRALETVEWLADKALRSLLTELLPPAEIVARVAADLAARKQHDATAQAQTRLTDIERRRARLLDAYESGSLDLMTWQGRDRVLGADADALAATIAAAPAPVDTDRLLLARARIARLAESGAPLEHRALLTEFGARVIVDLDRQTARVTVGPHYAALFPAAIAE